MNKKQEKLHNLFMNLAEKKQFNGAILVADGGEIIYKEAFGIADISTSRPLTTDSVFELASVSKPITAMGIMILKEQGKLDYEDFIEKWIPDFPYKGITIRQLLSHTSGLPDYSVLFIEKWNRDKIASNQDVLEMLKKYKPAMYFEPNEKWEYSNTGYVVLALIIEKVTGMSFEEYMDKYIFQPLGMKSSRVYNRRYNKEEISDYAYGYVYSHQSEKYELPDKLAGIEYVVFLDGMQGDGMISSNVEELFIWDRALYSEKLVTRKTLEEAFAPVYLNNKETFDYGFGWIIDYDNDMGKVVSHSGGWPGYNNYLFRYIDKNKTIIYLCNFEQNIDFQQQTLLAVQQILFDKPYTIPEVPKAKERVDIDESVYDQYIGKYLLDPGLEITVIKKDGKLFFQMLMKSLYELIPLSETRFFIKHALVELEFLKDEKGKVCELVIYQSGGEKAIRID
ncbi:serine hydrolase [Clostridium sp. Marseille-Q7071]